LGGRVEGKEGGSLVSKTKRRGRLKKSRASVMGQLGDSQKGRIIVKIGPIECRRGNWVF